MKTSMSSRLRKSKLFSGVIVISVLALLITLGLSGCVSDEPARADREDANQAPETASSDNGTKVPAAKPLPDWFVEVSGVRTAVLNAACLENAKGHGSHYAKLAFEKKGETKTYKAMPFHLIVAMADGEDGTHPYTFNRELWAKGYDITLVAADGYSSTFNTADIGPDALYIANNENGNPVAPMVVGDVPGNLWVRDLASVELALTKPSMDEIFALRVDINGKMNEFTIDDLEQSPWYVEDVGSFTTSAGTTYTNTYGGVWILAFKMDGEYLPRDPGYIRTIKVGPGKPNIDGHTSVKLIRTINIKGEEYKDFSLKISGKLSFDLDRQTMQSGVSCHKKTVTCLNKKTNAETEYTGIPLWRLFAYSDDPKLAPHKQDSSIISYDKDAADKGYKVKIEAADGFSVTLDSKQLDKNEDVIIGMYLGENELSPEEWPLVLVWNKNAKLIPEGIKAVRNITRISLLFN